MYIHIYIYIYIQIDRQIDKKRFFTPDTTKDTCVSACICGLCFVVCGLVFCILCFTFYFLLFFTFCLVSCGLVFCGLCFVFRGLFRNLGASFEDQGPGTRVYGPDYFGLRAKGQGLRDFILKHSKFVNLFRGNLLHSTVFMSSIKVNVQ